MSNLYVFVGLPGSGKSTWRERHATDDVVVISQDDLVEAYAKEHGLTYSEAFKSVNLKEFEKRVFAAFDAAVAEGKDIVLDRTNVTKKTRAKFLSRVPANYTTTAVVFECDPLVLEDRLAKRAKTGKVIPDFVLRDMRAAFQMPDEMEFHNVIKVVAEKPAHYPILQVKAAFKKFLSFFRG